MTLNWIVFKYLTNQIRKISFLDYLYYKFIISNPYTLISSNLDKLLKNVIQIIPLSKQNFIRDKGYMRLTFDTSVGILSFLSCFFRPSLYFAYSTLAKNIRYHKYDNIKDQFIEEIPVNGNGPIVIFVHGGAWGSGKPWMYRLFCKNFERVLNASKILIVGYSVFPDSDLNNQVDSIFSSLEYIYHHFELNKPVILIGHSSGANICSLCLLKHHEKLHFISILICLSGVYDISAHYNWEQSRGVHEISPMRGASGPLMDKYSPTLIISNLIEKKISLHFPNTLIIHSFDDATVPISSSIRFTKALQSLIKDKAEFYFPKVKHFFIISNIQPPPHPHLLLLICNLYFFFK